jgi:hypothetical protein
MAAIRYFLYFLGIGLLTWLLTALEIASPGSLNLQVYADAGDTIGTSEYSPVELIQVGILGVCGLLYAWVATHCPTQRPVAFLFGGMALAFFIRELDYFLDLYVADNFWQVLLGVVLALLIAYTYRQRRRFRIAWYRLWPSPGMTLLFAGATIIFAFVPLVGHAPLWMAILADDYHRVVKMAVEEFIELSGYFLWLIGTIEYTYQAKAIAFHEPQSVVAKRRAGRLPKSEGRF